MELLQLRYFIIAAHYENISQAARVIGIPQPSLSLTIQRLERDLNTQLFTRQNRRITLNESGRAFRDRITKALSHIDDAVLELNDIKGRHETTIKLYITENRANVLLCMSDFLKLHPKSRFIVNQGITDAEPPEFDLAITVNETFQGCEYKLIASEQIKLAIPYKHPLCDKEHIQLADLKDESFISMAKGFRLYELTCDIMGTIGVQPDITIQCSDPIYVQRYIEMGFGIGFVPSLSWRSGIKNVKVVDVEDCNKRRSMYLCWHKDRYMPKVLKQFAEFITDYFAKIE